MVLLLEPGPGEALQIPLPIIAFHDEELPAYADDALAAKFYQQWKAQHPSDIPSEKCIAYKVPLFLGGKDVVENLELSDLDVYLELCGQLRRQIAGRGQHVAAPDGGRIAVSAFQRLTSGRRG